ncbi:MAG: methyltransferase, TIGR04325 family [Chitinophagaceae bacterium]
MRQFLKQFLPPIAKRLLKYDFKYGWHGDYKNWNEALQHTSGYNAANILEKVRASAVKVKKGEVVYERDAITYDKAPVYYPVLAALLYAASVNNNKLTVLDYGGSLGTLYYQHRAFLQGISELHWCIVEQPQFVEAGKKEFEDHQLHFFFSVEEMMKTYKPDIVLFESSLQYFPDPYAAVEEVMSYNIPFFFIDRIAFAPGESDRLTIQKVPPAFYDASYPCWFPSKEKFMAMMNSRYELIGTFESGFTLQLGLQELKYEGAWFRLLSH